MKYSYSYIKSTLPKNKSRVSSLWVKTVARPLSYPLTFICANLGMSANFVSILSGIVSFVGCIFLALPYTWSVVCGVVLINFWIILDCVDGNIARVKKNFSRMGEFFDAAYGYIICAFDFLAIGIAAYNWSSFIFGEKSILILIIGALACSFNILPRLVYQKYTVMCMALEGSDKYEPENDFFEKKAERRGLTSLRLVVDRQIGTSGLFMPFLIICSIFKCYDVMVAFYCAYLGLSCIAVFILFSKKADNINKGT